MACKKLFMDKLSIVPNDKYLKNAFNHDAFGYSLLHSKFTHPQILINFVKSSINFKKGGGIYNFGDYFILFYGKNGHSSFRQNINQIIECR